MQHIGSTEMSRKTDQHQGQQPKAHKEELLDKKKKRGGVNSKQQHKHFVQYSTKVCIVTKYSSIKYYSNYIL
mgnify:CR=1 FL=1